MLPSQVANAQLIKLNPGAEELLIGYQSIGEPPRPRKVPLPAVLPSISEKRSNFNHKLTTALAVAQKTGTKIMEQRVKSQAPKLADK